MHGRRQISSAGNEAGRAAAVMVALGKELLSPESGEYLKVHDSTKGGDSCQRAQDGAVIQLASVGNLPGDN